MEQKGYQKYGEIADRLIDATQKLWSEDQNKSRINVSCTEVEIWLYGEQTKLVKAIINFINSIYYDFEVSASGCWLIIRIKEDKRDAKA